MTWILPKTLPNDWAATLERPSLVDAPKFIVRLPSPPHRRAIEAFAIAGAALDELSPDERRRVIRALVELYPEGIK